MTGTGSRVKDTGSGGRITGAFGYGGRLAVIDCDLKASSNVEGIPIDDVSTVGGLDCATVRENVIVGTGGSLVSGIRTAGATNSDVIRDNHISNTTFGIIVTAGTAGTSVDHKRSQLLGAGSGINTDNTGTDVEVSKNIVLGEGTAFTPTINGASGTSSKVSENYCDLATENCQDCVASGFCDVPLAPFLFP